MIEITKSLKYFMHFKYIYDKHIVVLVLKTAVILNILDALSTYIGLKYFDTIVERNTFVLSQIESLGLGLTMALKVLIVTVLLGLLIKRFPFLENYKFDKITMFLVFVPITLGLLYTVMSNIIVILNHSQIIP